MFENFDFSLLADPGFKEDAVREELIVPILNRLGYSASGENRIVRSKPLIHPFVYIGTKKYKVNVIPDYLLAVGGSTKWVLDAKAPTEAILAGKNVEQAYSYAIHKDVRVSIYGLCNGHTLAVFHISHLKPILNVPLTEINARWDEINRALSPMAFVDPERLDFFPDFGLAMFRFGGPNFNKIFFPWVPVHFIAKASDDVIAVTSTFDLAGDYCATFDLDRAMYQVLLDNLPEVERKKTNWALTRQPYYIRFEDNPPSLAFDTVLGKDVESNEREDYLPFDVIEVRRSQLTGQDMLNAFPYET